MSSHPIFPILKGPETPLGRHRFLSTRSSVRVSPLCMGAMQLGTSWTEALASGLDEKESFEYLDAFWNKGGNFIDTANGETKARDSAAVAPHSVELVS